MSAIHSVVTAKDLQMLRQTDITGEKDKEKDLSNSNKKLKTSSASSPQQYLTLTSADRCL